MYRLHTGIQNRPLIRRLLSLECTSRRCTHLGPLQNTFPEWATPPMGPNAHHQTNRFPQQPCTTSTITRNPTTSRISRSPHNLASSATADRELLTKLATSVAAINQHISQLNHKSTQLPPLLQTDTDSTTTSTALSSLTTSLTKLQQQLTELKKNASLRNSRMRRPRPRRDNGNYCWTHGYRIGNKHTSATCQDKASGHQDQAIRDNTMGGSLANKPDHL